MQTESMWRRAGRLMTGVAAAWLWASVTSAQTLPMEVRTPDEVAVPDGVVQLKLEVTEPRPIFTGGGGWSFQDYDQFLGLAVGGGGGDSAAAGVMRGATLKVRMVSPTNNLAVIDYPILTTALRVPSTATIGHQSTVNLSIDSFTGPGGASIPTIAQPGVVTVVRGASIHNVTPGSATVPAGGTITVIGNGFEPGTKIDIKGTRLRSANVQNNTTILIVPDESVTMHGAEVQLEIPSTKQKIFYYAYQRTQDLHLTSDSLMSAVEPAFQQLTWSAAAVPFPAPGAGRRLGLALQNATTAPVTITLRLVNGSAPAAPVTFPMPANTRLSVSLSEAFGTSCTAACTVRMQASAPIQILGLYGDVVADAVDPVLPTADVAGPPTVLDFTTAVGGTTFRTGDTFVTTATFTPGDSAVVADAYTVLQFPTGAYYSLTPSGLVPGILPLMRTTVAASSTVDLLRLPLPAGAPLGQYTWLSALAAPGTLNLLTPIRVSTFTVVP